MKRHCTLSIFRSKLLACLTILLFHSSTIFASDVLKPQLATIYSPPESISDYLISEKLDGIRGIWTGTQLLTKQGNIIHAPAWFTKSWPNIALDGELWRQRNDFEYASACVRNNTDDDSCWQQLRFMVFDMPALKSSFTDRYLAIKQLINQYPSHKLFAVEQFSVISVKQLMAMLDVVISQKGEGLMLHQKNAFYQSGRNTALMKLKKYFDAEAVVIKHISGKGKYKNKLGSLLVETAVSDAFPKKITFKIGSGFSDKERDNPPNIGDIITFKYFGTTRSGKPKFASYLRLRSNSN